MKLSKRMRRGSAQFSGNTKLFAEWIYEVAQLEEENAALKRAVQAAIDYFTDGITSKEQYDAYLRFVDAAQPFFGGEDDI